MTKGKITFILIASVVLILAVWIISTYNSIVSADKQVAETKAQIGVVCQRRLDLIPNLVEVVKGYAKHEKETFLAVTNARTAAAKTLTHTVETAHLSDADIRELEVSQKEVSKALNDIIVIVESYPDLKASTNFLALQDELEGSENRIAVERLRYNTAARIYNTAIKTFPGIIITGLLGYKEKPLFTTSDDAFIPVKVKL